MALNQCPIKVQKTKNSETILSKSQSKIKSRKNVFRNNFGGEGGGGGGSPGPALLVARSGSTH